MFMLLNVDILDRTTIDCYFCLNNISGRNRNNKASIAISPLTVRTTPAAVIYLIAVMQIQWHRDISVTSADQ